MSGRTLQRRLGEFGIVFNDLVDQLRFAAARSYLAQRDIAATEVAYLGFPRAKLVQPGLQALVGQRRVTTAAPLHPPQTIAKATLAGPGASVDR